MKKYLSILLLVCVINNLSAQIPEDALRFSWNIQSGTARIQAIGGAMGSLGGDITATFVNPAGLGFYRTGDVVISPSLRFGKMAATYLGRKEDTTANKFAFGTTGIVFGGSDGRKKRSTAVSIAINQMADFKSNVIYRSQNNQSSYSQSFLDEIRNGNIHDANSVAGDFPFGTSLAFNTYWIDTIGGSTNGNFNFQTRAPIATGLLQQHTVNTSGGITELAIGVGSNTSDKLLVGGTIGIPFLHLDRQSEFIEADATTDANNNFDYAIYRQGLTTTGVGLNLKAGLIYKAQDYLRLGFAVHSPTIYSLTDKNTAEITTNTEGYKGTQVQSLEDVTGFASEFRYIHMTPLKLIGSVSYVLREVEDITKQRGFLTADIEFVPYGMSRYYSDDSNEIPDQETKDYLKALNQAISDAYQSALNFRVGGELKFTTFMVRAGAAYYGNPYKNIHNEKGSRLNVSGGLGYRNKGFFVDATYVHSITKDVDVAYRLQNAPYFNADLRNTAGKILLTVGFKI